MGGIVTINSRRYDESIRRSWTCEFLGEENSRLLFLGKFDTDVLHPDLGRIIEQTRSYEYYWTDRWYNVFAFFEPDGRFRNLYFNISAPPRFRDSTLDYVDLDIDIVVWPDRSFAVLDEDEYESNAVRFAYPESLRNTILNATSELTTVIRNFTSPIEDLPDQI